MDFFAAVMDAGVMKVLAFLGAVTLLIYSVTGSKGGGSNNSGANNSGGGVS